MTPSNVCDGISSHCYKTRGQNAWITIFLHRQRDIILILATSIASCKQKPDYLQAVQKNSKDLINSPVQPEALATIDSLEIKYKRHLNQQILIKFDSLARVSDGEVAEAVAEAAVAIYNVNPTYFFKVVHTQHLKYLAEQWIIGESANLAVLQDTKRKTQLAAFKKAARHTYPYLSKGAVINADSLLNKINPALLD